jgi:hypothetical protein
MPNTSHFAKGDFGLLQNGHLHSIGERLGQPSGSCSNILPISGSYWDWSKSQDQPEYREIRHLFSITVMLDKSITQQKPRIWAHK